MCDAVAHGNPGAAQRMVSGAGGVGPAAGGEARRGEGGWDGGPARMGTGPPRGGGALGTAAPA